MGLDNVGRSRGRATGKAVGEDPLFRPVSSDGTGAAEGPPFAGGPVMSGGIVRSGGRRTKWTSIGEVPPDHIPIE